MSKAISLYVHVPYCRRKCHYCDFVSYVGREDTLANYRDRLLFELEQYKNDTLVVKTIFFGGGTPSQVDESLIGDVLEYVRQNFVLADDAEITVECNPCSADIKKLNAYKDFGVNRISIGVQSFNDNELEIIGRLHNSDKAVECVKNARSVGFENISIDLMQGIPCQTMESLMHSINTAISLDVDHISLYSLILEEGTPLYKMVESGKVTVANEDTDRLMYHYACQMLENAGYLQYEISNFAKTGFESRHNIAYWVRQDYVGIGCAAHSLYNGQRYSNPTALEEYLCGHIGKQSESREVLSYTDVLEEIVMLGLRMNKGIDLALFDDECLKKMTPTLDKLVKAELCAKRGTRFYATARGRDVLDSIIVDIISVF